jgi:hypothetical protein
MTFPRVLAAAVSGIAASLFIAGGAFAATAGTQASVIAMNQKAKNDAVSITYAYAPKDGTLAIYTSNPGKRASAKPIGEAALTTGDHRDVSVKLNGDFKSGTKLWAVVEQGKNGKPFKNLDGPAEQSFKVL